MSNYAYCPLCDGGLDEPTIREAVHDMYYCPHCDKPIYSQKTREDIIIELLERIEKLEELGRLNSLEDLPYVS